MKCWIKIFNTERKEESKFGMIRTKKKYIVLGLVLGQKRSFLAVGTDRKKVHFDHF
jgi:hypothetical protein